MKHAPSVFLRFASGLILIAATAALYLWQKDIDPLNPKVINSMVLVALAYTLATVSVNKLIAFPGRQTWLHILPTVGIAYSGVFALFALFFVTFSNSFVLLNAIITGVFFYLDFLLRSRREPLMAYIPAGRAAEAAAIPHARRRCARWWPICTARSWAATGRNSSPPAHCRGLRCTTSARWKNR